MNLGNVSANLFRLIISIVSKKYFYCQYLTNFNEIQHHIAICVYFGMAIKYQIELP